jgi:hypothetical protein
MIYKRHERNATKYPTLRDHLDVLNLDELTEFVFTLVDNHEPWLVILPLHLENGKVRCVNMSTHAISMVQEGTKVIQQNYNLVTQDACESWEGPCSTE